jgi:hypothetical protein
MKRYSLELSNAGPSPNLPIDSFPRAYHTAHGLTRFHYRDMTASQGASQVSIVKLYRILRIIA